MKTIIYLLLSYILIISCGRDVKKEDIYTVNITPENFLTFKASDIFDSYRVFHIEDDEFYIVRDHAFYGDKILVNMHCNLPFLQSGPQIKLKVYDYTGNYLYQIGAIGRGHGEYYNSGETIFIEKDSTISVVNNMQIINYNIDNSVNWQKMIYSDILGSKLNTTLGKIRAELNDSCYIVSNLLGEEHNYKLATISKDNKTIYHRFFKKNDKELNSSSGDNFIFYKYNNKLNVYNNTDNSIYELTQDSVILRYKITDKEQKNLNINLSNINETKNYLFINNNIAYDKRNHKSYSFSVIDDIILPSTMPDSLRELTCGYSYKKRIGDEWMFFELKNYGINFDIQNKITDTKESMTEKEWEEYTLSRPDVIEIYNRLPNKASEAGGDTHIPFVLSYKFKSNI